jgi:hypothetical protein
MPVPSETTFPGLLGGSFFSVTGDIRYKVAGVTIDPAETIPTGSAGTGTTLPDGQVIASGVKYFRFGAVLYQKTDKYYAPWDGSAPLKRGETVVVNRTVTQYDRDFKHPEGCKLGGECYPERACCVTGGVWTILTDAQWDQVLSACPEFVPVRVNRP